MKRNKFSLLRKKYWLICNIENAAHWFIKYTFQISSLQMNLMSLAIQILHIYVEYIIYVLPYCINIWDRNLFRKNVATLTEV